MIWIFVSAFGNAGFLVIGDTFFGTKELALANLPEAKSILGNGAYLIGAPMVTLGSEVEVKQTFRIEAIRSPKFTISTVPLFDTVISGYDLGPKNFYLI